MRDSDELYRKGAKFDDITWLNTMKQNIAEQIVFFKFAFSETRSEV